MDNYMKLEIPAKSVNEAFVRAAVGAFAVQIDMTVEDMADIKTATSEAVTNAIIHGYASVRGIVYVECSISGREITVTVRDEGCGIENVEQAMQPLYSGSEDDERSGMGFTVMQSFMDSLAVQSKPGEGTTVIMSKTVREVFDE